MTEIPPALRALLETGAALVRQSSSGRFALARGAGVVVPGALPVELREALPRALEDARRDTAVPLTPDAVEKVLRGAWGEAPGSRLDAWDAEPLAVTPTAQVHAAEHDGVRVAVKVRRPGLASAVRNDLALLDAVAAPLGAVLPSADVRGLLREIREAALDELDLEHEGSQQRQAARALRRVEDVTVPKVVGELSSEDVLVTERLDGPTLAAAAPEDPPRVARALLAAHVTALKAGIALTDPRPSHVVLREDGGIGLLGAGIARRADRDRARAALAAAGALRADDDAAWSAAVVEELGVLPAESAPEGLALLREVLGPFTEGRATLAPGAVADGGERALARLGRGLRLAASARLEPADLPASRMAGQLTLLLSRLEVEEDWLARVGEAAKG